MPLQACQEARCAPPLKAHQSAASLITHRNLFCPCSGACGFMKLLFMKPVIYKIHGKNPPEEEMTRASKCRDKDIIISPHSTRVSVMFNGRKIATSVRALDLKEGAYPAVTYLPLSDVNMAVLQKSGHKTHCPFKGEASYYDLVDGEKISANAVWYYADPCPLVAPIAGHVAFWGDDIAYVSENPS